MDAKENHEQVVNSLNAALYTVLQDLKNYEERKIGRDESPSGLTVSTCYVSDLKCFETALLDLFTVYPVERYTDQASAILGHEKWLKFAKEAKNGTEVTRLGHDVYGVPDEAITLAL